MYKNVLSSIPGIEYYPIFTLVLFFGFFIGLIIWYVRVDTKMLDVFARLPFEDDELQTSDSTETQSSGRS